MNQKVVIAQDLPSELQAFLEGMDYDKLFILTDVNTHEKCYPFVKGVPRLEGAPVERRAILFYLI